MVNTKKKEASIVEEVKGNVNNMTINEEIDDFERVLFHIGGMGRYQKLLFLMMFPFGLSYAFVYFGQMFITATPQSHWCKIPDLQHLDLEVRRNLSIPISGAGWEKCASYNANWSRVLETMTPPDSGTPTIPCQNGWDFEFVDIPYHTVVSQRGWVCNFSDLAPLAQSIYFGGSFVGGLFFGWLADRFGRLPALVGSNLIGIVGGVASVFTVAFWDFAFTRFLVGMAFDSAFMTMYILVLEYVGPRHRTWVANIPFALFFGTGCLVLPWLAIWISNWRNFLLATSLPMLPLVIAAPFVVPESARWLSSRGKINKAVEVLTKMGKFNGTKVPHDVMDDFIVSARETNEINESIRTLFKSPPLRKALLCMIFVFMCCALVFDGLIRMSESLGYNFYITFTLTSATEIPANLLLIIVLDRWGRRKLACGSLITAGVLIVIAACMHKGVAQVSLAICSRFFINMALSTIIQWATEILPTSVRATGSSAAHVSGFVAAVLSPFIVYSERVWSPLPLLLLALTSLAAGLVGLLLPETKGRSMPQTFAEGEKLMREYTICGKPEETDELEYISEKEKEDDV